MHPGLIGGIVGTLVGIAGGVLGTWFSVRNTNGPRERAFMIKFAAALWLGIALCIVLMVMIPKPWRGLVWIPFGILLWPGVDYANKRQQRIRDEEASESPDSS